MYSSNCGCCVVWVWCDVVDCGVWFGVHVVWCVVPHSPQCNELPGQLHQAHPATINPYRSAQKYRIVQLHVSSG